MKNFLQKFRSWIYTWLWILFTLWVWVFAYQFMNYQDIADVGIWEQLTSSTFNQLLANVRALSWSINELKSEIPKKWSDIPWWFMYYDASIQSWNRVYTSEISFKKWVYLVYFWNHYIYAQDWLHIGATSSSGTIVINSMNFFATNSPPLNTALYGIPPMVLKVVDTEALVTFRVGNPTYVPTILNNSDKSRFSVVKISD